MSTTQWQIWARYQGGREFFLSDVEVHEQRDDELSAAAKAFGDHFHLWLEGFPVMHPHFRYRQITLEGVPAQKPGRPRGAKTHKNPLDEPPLVEMALPVKRYESMPFQKLISDEHTLDVNPGLTP